MSRIRYALIAAAAVLLVAGCSSHKSPAHPPSTGHAVAAPATSGPASPAATATAGVSGTWSGQYSGSYQGKFTLRWHQTGSKLHGTIKLSAPAERLKINGTVNGGAISFGTVGSAAITYAGTVSGNSMSGSYQVHDGSDAGGPWSAAKTS
jgi:hypothetical protein